MGAPASQELRTAARLAEWQAEAKLSKRPMGVVACEGIRAIVDANRKARGLRGIADEAWSRMSLQTRRVLLMLATDRPDSNTEAMRAWSSFDDGEQVALGALARALRRDLEECARLR